MRVLILCAITLAGCYRPSVESCQYECNAATGCPSGFMCENDKCVDLLGVCGVDASTIDTVPPPDSPPDSPPVVPCFGSPGFSVCLETLPTTPLDLGPETINTDMDPRCSAGGMWGPGQPAACIIVATTITVLDAVTVFGSRPLLLVASDAINVFSTLDVASHAGRAGPATQSSSCMTGNTPVLNHTGGGAGGSFMSAGGNGGQIHFNGEPGGSAAPALVSAPTQLRGGCQGQRGGGPGSQGGNPGRGGGAVYLVAQHAMTITGTINASGSGGTSGLSLAGAGAGGGSGGMIVLWAATISTPGGTANLFANGGGAGSGQGTSDGVTLTGIDGTDPSLPAQGGIGGKPPTTGGYRNGGDGAYLAVQAGGGTDDGGSGTSGGGGGGLGYIQSNHAITVTTSPAPNVVTP